MSYCTEQTQENIPLWLMDSKDLDAWKENADANHVRWVESSGFAAKANQHCLLADGEGGIAGVLCGRSADGWLYQLSSAAGKLPEGQYRLQGDYSEEQRTQMALGWGLEQYRFQRYVKTTSKQPSLVLEDDIANDVKSLLDAQCLVRDLVNTPTEHMGPRELANAVQKEADEFTAKVDIIKGNRLLDKGYPAIHVVGRACTRDPRLIRMEWGNPEHPTLSLVGKGVCFDTGGLDLKSAVGMLQMKKDMGGAAHVLALARLVMQHKLPVHLVVLIPAVENSVAGNAYRPGDVISTRKGLSVEIGNTDAEGRLVMSDALTLATELGSDLVIDFATLTGAARVALGPDLPPLFSNRDEVAEGIQTAGDEQEDPLWTMPLYQPYKQDLKSNIADLNNVSKSSFGGCITAALFLEHFVGEDTPWVHIDTYAWNKAKRKGRPAGGEALGLRAVFHYLRQRYSA